MVSGRVVIFCKDEMLYCSCCGSSSGTLLLNATQAVREGLEVYIFYFFIFEMSTWDILGLPHEKTKILMSGS